MKRINYYFFFTVGNDADGRRFLATLRERVRVVDCSSNPSEKSGCWSVVRTDEIYIEQV